MVLDKLGQSEARRFCTGIHPAVWFSIRNQLPTPPPPKWQIVWKTSKWEDVYDPRVRLLFSGGRPHAKAKAKAKARAAKAKPEAKPDSSGTGPSENGGNEGGEASGRGGDPWDEFRKRLSQIQWFNEGPWLQPSLWANPDQY